MAKRLKVLSVAALHKSELTLPETEPFQKAFAVNGYSNHDHVDHDHVDQRVSNVRQMNPCLSRMS